LTDQEKSELEALLTKMMQPLTTVERQQFKEFIDRLDQECRHAVILSRLNSAPAKPKAFDKFVSAVCLEWLL